MLLTPAAPGLLSRATWDGVSSAASARAGFGDAAAVICTPPAGGSPPLGSPASRSSPKLKGSIGEGSNHSNFSHQSSVKILSKYSTFNYILLENSKNQDLNFKMHFSTFSKIFAKFRQIFHQALSKIQ